MSLTVTPVLSYYLLGGAALAGHEKDGFLLRFLKGGAEKIIRFSLEFPYANLIVVAVAVAVSAIFVLNLDRYSAPLVRTREVEAFQVRWLIDSLTRHSFVKQIART